MFLRRRISFRREFVVCTRIRTRVTNFTDFTWARATAARLVRVKIQTRFHCRCRALSFRISSEHDRVSL